MANPVASHSEGTRRQASHTQDPYANAYEHTWKDPLALPLKDSGLGVVAGLPLRNYEIRLGVYFLQQIYDYYAVLLVMARSATGRTP
jgi:hypothetical protein